MKSYISHFSLKVFERYGRCMLVKVNNKIIGTGRAALSHAFEVCTDNLMRKYYSKGNTRSLRAVKGRGSVGVLIEQYQPELTSTNEEVQSQIAEDLKNHHALESKHWDWEKISTDMIRSFELQRQDIVEAKEEVTKETAEKENTGAENEDDDVLPKPAIQQVKEKWPFLFRKGIMTNHHNRLTGRNLSNEMARFMEEELDFVLNFMTTCSKSNIKNFALRLTLEEGTDLTPESKVLAVMVMTANHFGEDFTSFLHGAEVC